MRLQIIAADLRYGLGIKGKAFSGKLLYKKTPVRVVFGDPKRNCEGFGICKMDMGETSLLSICKNAKIEYGSLVSEYNSEVCWLIIARESWLRFAIDYKRLNTGPSYLRISIDLANEIGLRANWLEVEAPELSSIATQIGMNSMKINFVKNEA